MYGLILQVVIMNLTDTSENYLMNEFQNQPEKMGIDIMI